MLGPKKKKTVVTIFVIIAVLLPAILSSGCAADAEPDPNNTWTVTDGLTYELLQDSYPPEVKEITVVMENRSDMVMRYGEGYYFEKYSGGEWRLANRLNNNQGFYDLGYSLTDHSRNTFVLQVNNTTSPLSGGLYRVIGSGNLDLISSSEYIAGSEDYVEHPPWQLEFRISKGADAAPDDEPGKKEWEWYVPDDVYDEDFAKNIKQFVTGENGLVAVLIKDELDGSFDTDGVKNTIEIFDRKTGARYEVLLDEVAELYNLEAYKDGFLIECDYLYYFTLSDSRQLEQEILHRDLSGNIVRSSDIPPDDIDSDGTDIAGTYIGTATATDAEYFRVKENLYFNKIKVGEVKDIRYGIAFDKTNDQYYINGIPAEKTELPEGGIYLESYSEYEGSMSLKSTVSLYFTENGNEVIGSMSDITYVYGALAATEIWSVTATKQYYGTKTPFPL